MRIMKKWPKCSKDFWQALSEFYFDNGDLEKIGTLWGCARNSGACEILGQELAC